MGFDPTKAYATGDTPKDWAEISDFGLPSYPFGETQMEQRLVNGIRKFRSSQHISRLTPKDLRFIGSIALFGFSFLFFVPVIYDGSLIQCSSRSVLCLNNPSGLKSTGYALFNWGAIYSLEYWPQQDGYSFVPGYLTLSNGSSMLLYGPVLLIFFVLPIATAGVGLVEPEIIGKSSSMAKSLGNLSRTGFVVLGVFMFMISASFLWQARVSLLESQGLPLARESSDLALALLGSALIMTGGAMILYALPLRMFPPYGTRCKA